MHKKGAHSLDFDAGNSGGKGFWRSERSLETLEHLNSRGEQTFFGNLQQFLR